MHQQDTLLQEGYPCVLKKEEKGERKERGERGKEGEEREKGKGGKRVSAMVTSYHRSAFSHVLPRILTITVSSIGVGKASPVIKLRFFAILLAKLSWKMFVSSPPAASM